jgi:DNA-binding NarL/FixJ family response regulator
MMLPQTKTVLIADDHASIRRGVRILVESQANFKVVAEAATGREALEAARRTQPDIAIIDYSLPELNGRDLTVQLRQRMPDIDILIYTMHDREELIVDALQAGARGFILKSDAETDLLAAVTALSRGRPFFSAAISRALLNRVLSHKSTHPLTQREREIVQLVAEGWLNKQIAFALNVSIKTVETHRASVMQKLDLHSAAELMRYAVRNQIVEA